MKEEHKHSKDCGPECLEAFEKMSDYVDGELDEKNKRKVGGHFSSCPICLTVLNTFKKTLEIFRSRKPDKIPPEMSMKLRETLRSKIKET